MNPTQVPENTGNDTRAEWIAPEVSELPLTELTQGGIVGTGTDAMIYS